VNECLLDWEWLNERPTKPGASRRSRAKGPWLRRGARTRLSGGPVKQLQGIPGPPANPSFDRDLRSLLWCSIDNDSSKDLDQLSVAGRNCRTADQGLVAIADVAPSVKPATPIDRHAGREHQRPSTRPPASSRCCRDASPTRPHIPQRGEDRLAVVIEIDGRGRRFRARVGHLQGIGRATRRSWPTAASPPAGTARKRCGTRWAVKGMEEQFGCRISRTAPSISEALCAKSPGYMHGSLETGIDRAAGGRAGRTCRDLKVDARNGPGV